MNVVKEIERINQKELENGIYGGCGKGSWHDKYKNSAWVYVGGLSYELSEGDIICVMSQWGEIEDVNLVREKGTNTSKGFAFIKYEDQRSTILAVDNFNGVKLLGRTLRVDHVDKYKLPKDVRDREEERLEEDPEAVVKIGPGHAYTEKELANEFSVTKGLDLWAAPAIAGGSRHDAHIDNDMVDDSTKKKHKKKESKEDRKHHKEKDKKHKRDRDRERSRSRSRDRIRERNKDSSRDRYRSSDDADKAMDTDRDRGSISTLSSIPPAALILPPELADAPAASWRGRRDPALAQAACDYQRRQQRALKEGVDLNAPNTAGRRDEFSGFGGMTRRR